MSSHSVIKFCDLRQIAPLPCVWPSLSVKWDGYTRSCLTTWSSRKWDTACLPRPSTPAAGPFLAILEPPREGWLAAQLAALHNGEQGMLQGGLDRGLEYQPFTRLPRFCWGSSSYKVEVRATRAVLVKGCLCEDAQGHLTAWGKKNCLALA